MKQEKKMKSPHWMLMFTAIIITVFISSANVLAESTGGFIVQAESEEQAQEMVLDHMHRVGTPYKSAPDATVSVLPSG